MTDKPTAAIGHIPFDGHRTCEHLFVRRRYFGAVPDAKECVPVSHYRETPQRNFGMFMPPEGK